MEKWMKTLNNSRRDVCCSVWCSGANLINIISSWALSRFEVALYTNITHIFIKKRREKFLLSWTIFVIFAHRSTDRRPQVRTVHLHEKRLDTSGALVEGGSIMQVIPSAFWCSSKVPFCSSLFFFILHLSTNDDDRWIMISPTLETHTRVLRTIITYVTFNPVSFVDMPIRPRAPENFIILSLCGCSGPGWVDHGSWRYGCSCREV